MKWVQSSSTLKAYIDNSIIYEFHIFEFFYLLKYICTPDFNTHGTFTIIHRYAQGSKKF